MPSPRPAPPLRLPTIFSWGGILQSSPATMRRTMGSLCVSAGEGIRTLRSWAKRPPREPTYLLMLALMSVWSLAPLAPLEEVIIYVLLYLFLS